MTPRIGLLLFTALLMQCENPVETPLPGVETVPAQIRQTDCFNGGNALFHAARNNGKWGTALQALPVTAGRWTT